MRRRRERGGRSADFSYSDSSHVPAVAGRSAGPPGGLCHVAAAEQSKKKGRARERKRDTGARESTLAATVQRRSREGGRRGWRWVNSGEILLVSVKDGPWSALVSWRRRGFSRASPVERGWWWKVSPRQERERGNAGGD